jgi:hypothetical protein
MKNDKRKFEPFKIKMCYTLFAWKRMEYWGITCELNSYIMRHYLTTRFALL